MNLPPFPVDAQSLDLLWAAMHLGPEDEKTSVFATLDMFSQLGGSDLDAVDEDDEMNGDHVKVMRDPAYHTNDVLIALITEIRRLRGDTS